MPTSTFGVAGFSSGVFNRVGTLGVALASMFKGKGRPVRIVPVVRETSILTTVREARVVTPRVYELSIGTKAADVYTVASTVEEGV